MRRWTIAIIMLLLPLSLAASHHIYDPQVKTLQAIVNQDWLSPTLMRLGTDDVLYISFDELSHDYHRYVFQLERCEADWSEAKGVFESDWLNGINHQIIEHSQLSMNTVIPYTHYSFQIPNDQCQLKMSGNYRIHILDEDSGEEVASVEFMVVESLMNLSLELTTNTDIDLNQSHQQLSVCLDFNGIQVTIPEDQIQLVVTQNSRETSRRSQIPATYRRANGLQWSHCHDLIFDGCNEYHKYEILDPSHPTMGIEQIAWDGEMYQVYPFADLPRANYLYDEDADGAFYIRNSDNYENDTESEYVWVNYRLQIPPLPEGQIVVDGRWTTEPLPTYIMDYDSEQRMYTSRILQKQGYYSYKYIWQTPDGHQRLLPSEGNFYQTENRYEVYIYYKGIGERTWRLTAFRGIQSVSSDNSGRMRQ